MKPSSNLRSKLAALAAAFFLATGATVSAGTITNPTSPETVWKDVAGGEIINNCGNVLRDDDGTFYWYGWNKYAKTVRVYASTTLASDSWELRATLLSDGSFHGRPDVIKHPTNGTYVMIVECSTSGVDGRNGIQYYTATSPLGPFTLQLQENQVLKNNTGELVDMGDKGIYQDDDESRTAYLICAADDGALASGANDTHKIIRLKPDYIGQEALVRSWGPVSKNRREALAIFKRNGVYYMTSSGTHGWRSGETWYKTADAIDGSWTDWANVPTSPTSGNSFNTQHDFILTIAGTQATSYIYLGDRWSLDTGVGYGRNAWFPLTFDAAGTPTLEGATVWSIDPLTGVIEVASTPPPPPSPAQTLTFSPTKDAMIKEAAPTTNFGAAAQMQVSANVGFRKIMFLQFAVNGVPPEATVTGASLLLVSKTTGSGRAITAHAVADTGWTEAGITWNHAPAVGAVLSTVAEHTAGEDSVWSVSSHVTGNGMFAFGLDSAFSGDTNFQARESGAGSAPSLVVTYSIPDTTPPVLQLPADIELEATCPDGASATFVATADDAIDGPVSVSLSKESGTIFPLGTTVVTARATDAAGNTVTGSFSVTVTDSTAPVLTGLNASPEVLWPANHKLVPVSLRATASDIVDPEPVVRIVSVTSNEPANGSGDGDEEPDAVVSGALALQLRAERAGRGSGRVYTIVIEARDGSGNAATRSIEVLVPHDRR